MQQYPITIRKHWAGYTGAILLGAAAAGALWGLIFYLRSLGLLDETILAVLTAGSAVSLIVAVLRYYVLWLSYMQITEDGLLVVNYSTLLLRQETETKWSRVQDVQAQSAGLPATVLGYGTLVVQTAGTEQTLKMTLVPEAQHYADLIADHIS